MYRIVLTLLLMAGIYTAMRSFEAPEPEAAGVQGAAYVHDGDTFTVAGVKIRLFGIDAPEMAQTCEMPDGTDWACGRWSRDEVRRILTGQDLRCIQQDRDRYGRMVARCFLQDQDLAERLVREGIVFSYARYSRDYIGVENRAKAAQRGLWQAKTVAPAEYRRQKREN